MTHRRQSTSSRSLDDALADAMLRLRGSRASRLSLYRYNGTLADGRSGPRQHRWRDRGRRCRRVCSAAASRPIDILEARAAQGPRSAIDSAAHWVSASRTLPIWCCSRGRCTRSPSRACRCCAACAVSPPPRTTPCCAKRSQDVLASLEAGRDLAASFARHPQALPAAVREHRARGRIHRHAGEVISAAGGISGAGSGHAGPRQERDALSDHRRDHDQRWPSSFLTTFVIPKFAPLFARPRQRHSLADAHHHRRLGLRPARMVRGDRRRDRCRRDRCQAIHQYRRRADSSGTG